VGLLNKQTDKKIKKYQEKVEKSREKYKKSPEYPLHMSSVFLQHLNLMSNNMGETEGFGPHFIIEWMDLYKKMAQKHPEEFAHLNIQKTQNSLQKSIECSCDSRLIDVYIKNLKNDQADSFLVIPITLKITQGNEDQFHGVSAIITKEQGKILVSVCDKAGYLLEDINKIYINREQKQIKTIYQYKFDDTKENIKRITKALRIGRGHIKGSDIFNLFSTYKKDRYPLAKLGKHATGKEFINTVGTSQYLQGNCHVNNLDAALRYLLAPRESTPIDHFITAKMDSSWRDKFKELFLKEIETSNFGKNLNKNDMLNYLTKSYEKYSEEKKQLKVIVDRSKKINTKMKIRKSESRQINQGISEIFKGKKPNHMPKVNQIFGNQSRC
jgi:hypothetical protein